MKLAHTADLHLGFRQHDRLMPDGTNQREADIARAFTAQIDKLIELKPDIVVIAGDVFHLVRPPTRAILHAFRQFRRLKEAIQEVVVVAGNHDLPMTTSAGCILPLFEEIGVRVIDRQIERLHLFGGELQLLCVPDIHGNPRPPLRPEPGSKYRVLLLHGEIAGVIPAHTLERMAVEIPVKDLHSEEWDYIALGHYHQYQQVGPNAYYSGSLEYTSTNFWAELEDGKSAGKGFVLRDLDTGAHEFIRLEPQRGVLDFPEFSAQGMTAAEVDARMAELVNSVDGGLEGKIVRMRINHIPRSLLSELDQKQLRDFKRSAFNFRLVTAKAEAAVNVRGTAPMIKGRRESLPDKLKAFITDPAREAPPDIDKNAVAALGLKYLDEASAVLLQEEKK